MRKPLKSLKALLPPFPQGRAGRLFLSASRKALKFLKASLMILGGFFALALLLSDPERQPCGAEARGAPHSFGGGFVASTAAVEPTAFVQKYAAVCGSARVLGRAMILDHARVSGSAEVSGKAWIFSHAKVSGEARVSGRAAVGGWARVLDNAKVFGNARVLDHAKVSGDMIVGFPPAAAGGSKKIGGQTDVFGRALSRAPGSFAEEPHYK